MKKNLCIIMALAVVTALLISSGPVLAYTVTGDLATPGTYNSTTTGYLWNVLSGIGGGIASYRMDYIVATGADGSLATFSGGEINPSLGNGTVGVSNAAISADVNGDGGYTVTGDGQTVTNVTNVSLYRASAPPGNYPGGSDTAFTVSGNGITSPVTFTPAGATALPQTDTITVSGASHGKPYTWTYTGESLTSLLQSAGVKTSNLNQIVIATGNDGFVVTMSMGEIVSAGNLDMVADMTNDTTALYYNLDGSLASNSNGFARTILGVESANGLWDQELQSLDVVATPLPASAFLFAPALAGLGMLRRRFTL